MSHRGSSTLDFSGMLSLQMGFNTLKYRRMGRRVTKSARYRHPDVIPMPFPHFMVSTSQKKSRCQRAGIRKKKVQKYEFCKVLQFVQYAGCMQEPKLTWISTDTCHGCPCLCQTDIETAQDLFLDLLPCYLALTQLEALSMWIGCSLLHGEGGEPGPIV